MAKSIPLLRVTALLPFVNFLEELGSPTEKLLKQCKLPIFALDEPNMLIPRHQVFAFIEKSAYQEGIQNLGFLVGEKTSLHSFGILGKLACQSLTLYDAISKVIHFGNLFNSSEHYWLFEQENTAYFCQEYVNLKEISTDYASNFSLMLMIDLIQRVGGKKWYPQQISLQTNKISKFTNHPLSETNINREINITSIAFPSAFLTLPFDSLPNFSSVEQQKDYEILRDSTPSSQFVDSLRQAMMSQLKDGYPSINLASEMAQMSIRTLQRTLTKDSLTYSQLITRIRYEKAVYLLKHTPLKMIEIAYELGYEDPAHFSRAFKRWTGKTPHNFRCDKRN